MSIANTIMALYSIACEANKLAHEIENEEVIVADSVKHLRSLLDTVSSQSVQKASQDLQSLLGSLANISNNLRNMKIANITTSADPVNRIILVSIDAIFGSSIVSFDTVFDRAGAQSIVDGINLALNALKPGTNLNLTEGNA